MPYDAKGPDDDDLIKIATVLRMAALSRSSVYAEMKKGAFPQQVRQTTRSVAWVRSEVQAWIAQRKGQRRK